MLRFSFNLKNPTLKKIGILSAEELNSALINLTRKSQQDSFPEEYSVLLNKKSVFPSKSPMLSLRPFMDDNGCIRVGGRLNRSMLSYNEKHPYIISKSTTFAKLLVEQAHVQTLHGGQELKRNILLQKFWILNGRSYIRSVLKDCFVCARRNARTLEQVMGHLPEIRVKPQRPFLRTGVDYAGPFWMKSAPGRGRTSYKGYICLFICLVTKAVHLELVSNLSTEGFISAFQRFVSRRGKCVELVSDNGSNFRGASAELSRMFSQASDFYRSTATLLANEGTEWSFIPPSAPHFGGLWEAGVKSVKVHLRKVIGEQKLTYEEMFTLLTQIEACLNSRPLYAISNDSSDAMPLTPGHFLIGEPLLAIPEVPITSTATPANRYKLVTQMRNHFWKIWSKDYLSNLQQLHRWRFPRANIEIGNIVLIKDEQLPPTKWALAKVEKVHYGQDGKVRVAEVKSSKGIFTRPIVKLVPLPTGNS